MNDEETDLLKLKKQKSIEQTKKKIASMGKIENLGTSDKSSIEILRTRQSIDPKVLFTYICEKGKHALNLLI